MRSIDFPKGNKEPGAEGEPNNSTDQQDQIALFDAVPEQTQANAHERIEQPRLQQELGQRVLGETTHNFSPRLPVNQERKGKMGMKKRLAITAAVTATAIGVSTLIGGIVGANSNNDPRGPRHDTTTSGPPVAGGGETVAPSSEVAPANPNMLPEGFEYQLGGMTYETREEFVAANEISAEEYPDGADAMPAIINRGFNGLMLAGANIYEHEQYKDYQPDTAVPAGAMSLAKFAYGPAITEAIAINEPPFLTDVNKVHLSYVNYVLGSQYDPAPYFCEWNYVGHESALRTDNTYYESDATITLKDNADQIPRIAEHRDEPVNIDETYKLSISIQQVPGVNGNMVWKIADIGPGVTMNPGTPGE